MENDRELIYLQSLETEYKQLKEHFMKLVDQARDKQFAISYWGGIYTLQLLINNGGLLSKRIKEHFEGSYKLGSAIPQIIAGIPEIITAYQREAHDHRQKNKRKLQSVGLKWKKNRYGIPIALPEIELKIKPQNDPYFVAGPFADLSNPSDIAYELGKMFALDKFIGHIKEQYLRHGGKLENFSMPVIDLKDKWQQLKAFLASQETDKFFTLLQSLFASLPYQLSKAESDYHNIIHTVLNMLGFEILSELPTNAGRIDTVVQTERIIYIMEFKVDSDLALDQIERKKYYERFMDQSKKIVLVGVNISSTLKNVAAWKIKEIDPMA